MTCEDGKNDQIELLQNKIKELEQQLLQLQKKKDKTQEIHHKNFQSVLYQAQHDQMTGFYNKQVTAEKINELLVSDTGKYSSHVFFIIDLDYFKQVNDCFGHPFGDEVLTKTAKKIRALFRNEDILGRIGGDEFIVLMKNVLDKKIAYLKAKEICESVAEHYMQNEVEHKVTVSVGIALYDCHGHNFEELYHHSDIALYQAKEQGRNHFA
ncbi:MAG: GGDEF domain-containing protein, partial [Lachnospiraceae bacterium]